MAHYLITGHTGFKGAWLIFLLKAQGHDVSGLALDPIPGSIFERTKLESDLVHDFRVDIRNKADTVDAIAKAQPDYVIHMAAQALVREGYRNPLYTYETNVLGTLNVLEAVDQTDSVRAQLIVTTDKVYLDQGLNRPYVETDPLGGKDPYSASKAMADILAQEYLSRDGVKPGAIARAGNVIGAGDVSHERLLPDVVRAIATQEPVVLRYPNAVRPWQHVLDCLSGYLVLLDRTSSNRHFEGAFNFGPTQLGRLTVEEVMKIAIEFIGEDFAVQTDPARELKEDSFLFLESAKAFQQLGWANHIDPSDAIRNAIQLAPSASKDEVKRVIRETISGWKVQSKVDASQPPQFR